VDAGAPRDSRFVVALPLLRPPSLWSLISLSCTGLNTLGCHLLSGGVVLLLAGVSTGFVRVPLQRCLAAQVDSHSAVPSGGERRDGVLANDGLRAAWVVELNEMRECWGRAAIAELSLPGRPGSTSLLCGGLERVAVLVRHIV